MNIILTLRWTPSGTRWVLAAITGAARGDEPAVLATSKTGYRSPSRAYLEGCRAAARYGEAPEL